MKLEKTWSASSKHEDFGKGDELINLAGRWSAGIKVNITKPYTYSKGPIINNIINE